MAHCPSRPECCLHCGVDCATVNWPIKSSGVGRREADPKREENSGDAAATRGWLILAPIKRQQLARLNSIQRAADRLCFSLASTSAGMAARLIVFSLVTCRGAESWREKGSLLLRYEVSSGAPSS